MIEWMNGTTGAAVGMYAMARDTIARILIVHVQDTMRCSQFKARRV